MATASLLRRKLHGTSCLGLEQAAFPFPERTQHLAKTAPQEQQGVALSQGGESRGAAVWPPWDSRLPAQGNFALLGKGCPFLPSGEEVSGLRSGQAPYFRTVDVGVWGGCGSLPQSHW